jgi:DNA-binding protein HU-beta
MTKTELVNAIAGKSGFSKVKSAEALGVFIEAITGALKKGDKVTIVGFGTFEVAKRAARSGVNPRTKEKIKIRAAKVPRFRPGQALKDEVNAKK